jgi:hypothetical protein
MMRAVVFAVAVVCAATGRAKFTAPARQRSRLVLPNRGERRAVGDRRTVFEIVSSS